MSKVVEMVEENATKISQEIMGCENVHIVGD